MEKNKVLGLSMEVDSMLEKIKSLVSENFNMLVGYKEEVLENGNVQIVLEVKNEINSGTYDFENIFSVDEFISEIEFKSELEEKIYDYLKESFKIEEKCYEVQEIGKVKRVIFDNPKILVKGLNSKIDFIENFTKHLVLNIGTNDDKNVYIDLVSEIEIENVELKPKENKIHLGKSIYGEDLYIDYGMLHTSISGGTGVGKTILLYNIIKQMNTNNDEMHLIDLKYGCSFSPLKEFDYKVYTNDDLEKINKLLNEVMGIVSDRWEKVKEEGKNSIINENNIVLFIEEIEFLKFENTDLSKEILKKIEWLLSCGRSSKVFVILTTQKDEKSVYGRNGWFNIHNKIVGRTNRSDSLLKKGNYDNDIKIVRILPRNKGYFVLAESNSIDIEVDLLIFRTPFLSEEEFFNSLKKK